VRENVVPGGCVIKLAFDPSPQPEVASGIIIADGAIAPVHAVRVGANTIVTPDGEVPQNSEQDRERWSRLIGALGAKAWERMRRWDVCLVGVGRNGSLVAHALVRAGIHQLTLVDPDALELHNLDAMDMVGEGDISKPKVCAIAEHLHAVNRGVILRPLPVSAFAEAAVTAMQEADLLVSCVDDNAARLFVSLVAVRHLKPHLDIGTGILTEHAARVIGADIRLIMPGDGCLLCIGGVGDAHASLERLVIAQAGLELPQTLWNQQRLGSLRSVNQMAVATGMRLLETLAEEGIDRSYWVRLEWDRIIPRTRLVSYQNSVFCPICILSDCGDR
jgi:molybdopterin/thiamine biosynthesis adenylyltransferase